MPASKKPKFRLSEMVTSEISLVDLPANLRKFLVAKAAARGSDGTIAGGGSPTAVIDEVLRSIANNEFPGAEDLAIFPFLRAWYSGWDSRSETLALGLAKRGDALPIPFEARAELIEAVMDSLEKLAGVTASLKASVIDDSSEVPQEIVRSMRAAAVALLRTADRYLDTRPREIDPGPGPDETAKARKSPREGWTADELTDLSAATMAKAKAQPSNGIDPETSAALDSMVIDANEQDRRAAKERAEIARLSKNGEPAWPMDLSAAVAAKKEGTR